MSLRPAIPRACRAALVADGSPEAAGHTATCAFCTARAAARATLGPSLRAAPKIPDELRRPAFLDSVYDRAVDLCEQEPVADWLGVAPRLDVEEGASSDPGLEESPLARELLRRPESPDATEWARVRESIVAEVATPTPAGRASARRWPTLLAGAAAAAIIAAISVSDGTPTEPRIVFTELTDAPDVPFAIVRYGAKE